MYIYRRVHRRINLASRLLESLGKHILCLGAAASEAKYGGRSLRKGRSRKLGTLPSSKPHNLEFNVVWHIGEMAATKGASFPARLR